MPLKNKTILYEVNAPVYLNNLSRKYGGAVTFASIPEEEIKRLADLGIDAVWVMGVWERSPRAIAIGRADAKFQRVLDKALPDRGPEDFIGSAYSVRDYVVDPAYGGEAGLAELRGALSGHGIGLMLDFVPNHTAPDHPWVSEHPEYYIAGSAEDLADDPDSFIDCGGAVFAKGRDPQFEAWSDAVQLNAFSPAYRRQAIATLSNLAQICDGVRCDMTMLMMNEIFGKTWGQRAGAEPSEDYWEEVIAGARAANPGFVFLAESYWNKEAELIKQGFDFCYDKVFYDELLEKDAGAVMSYLKKTEGYQEHLARFTENHDEPRAAREFGVKKGLAAAVAVATTPGLWLLHDGQMEGFKVRLPVHLGRGPMEETDGELYNFYRQLLEFVKPWKTAPATWQLLKCDHEDVMAWQWLAGKNRYTVIINYGNNNVTAKVDGSDSTYELGPWQAALTQS